MALPTPPPQAANNYVPNGANISHQTIQPPLRDNVMGTPGPSLQRAFRVEAVVGPQDYDAQGNNPSVEPLGWEWAGLVPTGPAPHQGWVRFHLLNAHLGGPGNREWNLVPTTNYWNSCADWQTNFEEYAKAEVNTNGNVIAFEVEVTYHQNAVHVPQELGDNELEKFPSKIEAQYHVWDAANSRWKTPSKPHSQVELNIPAPPTTAGNVEMLLTDIGESTLTKLYKLDHWLASRIVGSRNKLALAHPATLQDLYDFYCEWIPIYDPGKEPGKWQSRLSSAWTKLEDALLRTQGLSLRIYNGWSPQNNAARAVRLPPEQRREKAQREKLQAAVAERKKKEAEAQKQLRQQESGNLLDSILGAMDKSQKETARYQYGPSSQQKQEKKEKKEGGRFNPY